jgi:hypothetical protein
MPLTLAATPERVENIVRCFVAMPFPVPSPVTLAVDGDFDVRVVDFVGSPADWTAGVCLLENEVFRVSLDGEFCSFSLLDGAFWTVALIADSSDLCTPLRLPMSSSS